MKLLDIVNISCVCIDCSKNCVVLQDLKHYTLLVIVKYKKSLKRLLASVGKHLVPGYSNARPFLREQQGCCCDRVLAPSSDSMQLCNGPYDCRCVVIFMAAYHQ